MHVWRQGRQGKKAQPVVAQALYRAYQQGQPTDERGGELPVGSGFRTAMTKQLHKNYFGNYTTTQKATLETERAKGHVLCTCRALYVYAPAVNIIGIGMLKFMLRMKHLYISLFIPIAQTWSSRSFFILILSPMCGN
jgi:hypothetical protein